jgi:hypothetical protein
MCDYSLEMYRSRPAQKGEEYISNRFPTGTVGFVCPGDQSVAICMECDMKLELSHIPPAVQEQAKVGESANATFARIDEALHRDAVRFDNGKVLSLQVLGPGVAARLLSSEPVAIEHEIPELPLA